MSTPDNIDPNAREHNYQQLAKLLRHRIEHGDLKDQERLPSIAQITRKYGQSVGTVRRALGILAGDGVLVIVPQRGIFRAGATRPGSDTTGS